MISTPLVVLGAGRLGRALIRQLVEAAPFHRERHHFDYRVAAWADLSGVIVDPEGLAFDALLAAAEAKEQGDSFAELFGSVAATGDWALRIVESTALQLGDSGDSRPILVDASSSAATAPALEAALAAGWRVVTANKLPLAATQELFDRLTATLDFRYEATVGSAVPVIEASLGLLRAGDRIDAFRGALSGTLGFIATGLEEGRSFSGLVREAIERGYTEKDPRVDLGGRDVARKALILARTIGLRMEGSDIAVESLVPADYAALPLEDFVARLPELDSGFRELAAGAAREGRVLRFIAEYAGGRVGVGPRAVERSSALGRLRGNDNLLAFTTRYYPGEPLVLQGRGLGVEAAASGVHADLVAFGERDASAGRPR